MRKLFSGFLAAGLLTGQVAVADPCARPVEKTAFDVTALKSQLMVTALACNAQDKYNAFVTKFRGELVKQERALNSYFGRAYGRRGRQQHDDYITSLANAQSEAGTRLGSAYCQQRLGMFDQVMVQPSLGDLSGFVVAQAIVQPVALIDCPAPVHRQRTAQVAAAGRPHH
jgi:hypothetical protein